MENHAASGPRLGLLQLPRPPIGRSRSARESVSPISLAGPGPAGASIPHLRSAGRNHKKLHSVFSWPPAQDRAASGCRRPYFGDWRKAAHRLARVQRSTRRRPFLAEKPLRVPRPLPARNRANAAEPLEQSAYSPLHHRPRHHSHALPHTIDYRAGIEGRLLHRPLWVRSPRRWFRREAAALVAGKSLPPPPPSKYCPGSASAYGASLGESFRGGLRQLVELATPA